MKSAFARLTLVIIFLVGCILRLVGLNDPVSYDEAYTYVAFASRSLWGIISDYSLPNNHIFHSLLVHASTQLLGNHLWSLRIPALLAGLALILVAYRFGKSLYGREVGLTAAALVAWFPVLINFSTEARGYSLVSLFTLLIFWLGWRVTRQPDWQTWALLTVCSALGFWTVPIMLFPAGALYLWLLLEGWFVQPNSRRVYFSSLFCSGLGTAALTGLLYAPVLWVSGWHELLANGFVRPLNMQDYYFGGVLADRLIDTWLTWTNEIPFLLTVLLILGIVLSLIFHWYITSSRVPLLVVLLGWIALVVVLRRPDAYDRFWSFLIAPLLVWAAAGWLGARWAAPVEHRGQSSGAVLPIKAAETRLFRLVQTHRIEPAPIQKPQAKPMHNRFENMISLFKTTCLGLVVSFIVIQAIVTLPSYPVRWNKQGNPQAAALYFKGILRSGDIILAGYPHNAPLWYYLRLYGVDETVWQVTTPMQRVYFVLATNQKGQTLTSIAKSYKLDPALFAHGRIIKVQRYGQLVIYRYDKKETP